MGSSFKKPPSIDSQASLYSEANRLLQSYSYLVKSIIERGKFTVIDEMKQNTIHQQWSIIISLLHESEEVDKLKHKFKEYHDLFTFWKYRYTDTLQTIYEEPLLS